MTGFGQHVRWTDERVSDRPALRWRAEAMLFLAAYLASTSSPPVARTSSRSADSSLDEGDDPTRRPASSPRGRGGALRRAQRPPPARRLARPQHLARPHRQRVRVRLDAVHPPPARPGPAVARVALRGRGAWRLSRREVARGSVPRDEDECGLPAAPGDATERLQQRAARERRWRPSAASRTVGAR
jgi:hypothetical protein